jgi:DNA-binding protein HU-beta
MNKGTFEKSLVGKLKFEKKVAHKLATIMIESLADGIVNDDKVTLIGLGTFDKIIRQPRAGRNPKTGAALQIPKKAAIRFSPGKALKEAINGATVVINVDSETEDETAEEAEQSEAEAIEALELSEEEA